tara:strand:+ start:1403 stop:3682 length:2280 start_codon:yes stop_codon:yes gene_type:complete
MTTNTVDIEVRLDGAEEAKKGLTGIGETAASMADRFDKSNSHLGEGLGSLVGNVEDAQGAFKDLSSTVKSLGTGGKASFLSLIPAIGGVIAVGYALYETFINITGAAQAAEDANEAAAAAAADLQAKLEALAEKGVEPTTKELERFTRAQLMAQLAKEKMEKQTEKISRKLAKETKAQDELTDAIINRNSTTRKLLTTLGFYNSVSEARIKLDKAKAESSKAITSALNDQRKAQKKLKDAEAQFIAFEERSAEFVATKTKENIERLKTAQLLEAEQEANKDLRDQYKFDLEDQHMMLLERLELVAAQAKFERNALDEFANNIREELKLHDLVQLKREDIDRRRAELLQKRNEENAKAAAARLAQAQTRLAAEKLLEERAQNELFALRALQLQQIKANGASALEVLDAQHQLELDKAGENNTRRLAADIKYQMSRTQLEKTEADKRAAEEKRQADQRRAFILDSRAFDIDMMHDGIDKELAALELRYDREKQLKEHSEKELTELTRRFTLERTAIQNRALNEQIQGFNDLALSAAESFGRDATKALYDSLTDESFNEARRDLSETVNQQIEAERKAIREFEGTQVERVKATEDANQRILDLQREFTKSRRDIEEQEKSALPRAIGEILVALGQQAAVESLMFGAKAIAALFTNPALAANYGIASGVMAGAAASAGIYGRSLGASSAPRGGGGSPSVSPLGTPQVAPDEGREQAETSTTVFNVNFGGAVVYDTRRAAEIALADRITTLQNMNRRGAPRRRF